MPRAGRLHIDEGYYHVMGRGLERRWIFKTKKDKEDFLDRLGESLKQNHSKCLAWSLMSNHYHLLIQVNTQPLSRLMGKLLSGYATQYNRRHGRSGYVFQNRYKSILIDADQYLLELIRYIHLNPIRAKIVQTLAELDRYRWTGHAGLLGKHLQNWHCVLEVLRQFARKNARGRKLYRQFMKERLNSSDEMGLSGGGLVRSYGGWEAIKSLRREHEVRIGDERILGESDFVERVLKHDELTIVKKAQLEQIGWNLERLINKVCRYFEISERDIRKKGRSSNISTAKSLICYWSMECLNVSSSELIKRLALSQPAISKSARRGERYCLERELDLAEVLS